MVLSCKSLLRRLGVALFVGEMKMKRVVKPMIEMAIREGIIKEKPEGLIATVMPPLSVMLDAIDAKLLARGGEASALDICWTLLDGLSIDIEDTTAIEAYAAGFQGGLVAMEAGFEAGGFENRANEGDKGIGEHYSQIDEGAEKIE